MPFYERHGFVDTEIVDLAGRSPALADVARPAGARRGDAGDGLTR